MKGRVLVLAAVLTGGVAACSSDSTAATRASVDGTYTLSTVNGSPLPFTTDSTAAHTVQVLSGQKTATSISNGTLDVETTEVDRTVSQSGAAVEVDTVRQSENLTFDGTNFATAAYVGTIRNDTMMIYRGGLTYQYLRAR